MQLAFSGAEILLSNGQVFNRTPGIITLPVNSTVAVYITEMGSVAYSPEFPDACIPLAYVTTDTASIIDIEDVRHQNLEQVRPIRLPQQVSPFITGEVRAFGGVNAPPGWLLCQGQTLNRNTYISLFNVIGYAYGGSGNTFRLPDLRGRVVVGAGNNGSSEYDLGQTGGTEAVKLTVSQMPKHSHGVNDLGHSHATEDRGHSHRVTDGGHTHGHIDRGHRHNIEAREDTRDDDRPQREIRKLDYGDTTSEPERIFKSEVSTSNIEIGASSANVSVNVGYAGITVQPTTTGVTLNQAGADGYHENRQPFLALNYIIKT